MSVDMTTDFIFLLYRMAKSRKQKEEIVSELEEKMKGAKAMVFTNFDGLSVSEADELRKNLRENNIQYMVAKRTLIGIALKKADLQDVSLDDIEGGIGVAFGDDEVLPAKTLADYAKKAEALELVGGIVEGEYLDTERIKALAAMPSKEELLVKLMWLVQYPTTGLVNVLAGTPRSFVQVLNAIKESKE